MGFIDFKKVKKGCFSEAAFFYLIAISII